MKKLLFLALSIALFTSCKDEKKETDINVSGIENADQNDIPAETTKEYPAQIVALMNAHGGMEKWKMMNNLCFNADGKSGEEIHTVSLKDRKAKIETKDWTIGNNGNDVWLLENEKGAYKGNARFYNNLMFYFYAMPFVLGDDGIVYEQLPETELDGKMYSATKISYNDGIGDSPKDEYIVYSDPETNQMAWLAYTVTYMDGKKSDDFHYIKYDTWQDVNGLQLPQKITWYNMENGKPKGERNDMNFKNISLTETILESSVFEKPGNAVVVKR